MTTTDLVVSMPKLVTEITLKVRWTRVASARIWIASWIVKLASIVAGCDADVAVLDSSTAKGEGATPVPPRGRRAHRRHPDPAEGRGRVESDRG